MSSEIATNDVDRRSDRFWQGRHGSFQISVAIVFFFAARLSLRAARQVGWRRGVLAGCGRCHRDSWWRSVRPCGGRSSSAWSPPLSQPICWAIAILPARLFAVANAGGPLIVAGLIQRFYGAPFELNELRRVFGLFGATIVAALVERFRGHAWICVLSSLDLIRRHDWRHWVTSETLGTITVAPLVIGLASFLRNAPPTARNCGGGFRALGRGHALFAPGLSAQ